MARWTLDFTPRARLYRAMKLKGRLPRNRAFTLLEVMIAVAMIAIMAVLARPAIVRSVIQARGSALMNDLRVFAEAYSQYAHANGAYPASYTTAGGFPAAMAGSITPTQWMRPAPIGGNYAFLNGNTVGGVRYKALLRVSGSGVAQITFTSAQMLQLDGRADNGDLATGRLFSIGAALTTYFVVEQ